MVKIYQGHMMLLRVTQSNKIALVKFGSVGSHRDALKTFRGTESHAD